MRANERASATINVNERAKMSETKKISENKYKQSKIQFIRLMGFCHWIDACVSEASERECIFVVMNH